MKRIALSIILILSGCLYAQGQSNYSTNDLINMWEARQKAAKQRYGNGNGNNGRIQYNRESSEMKDFKSKFNIGEEFKNNGEYALACDFYMKALKVIQNTSDANLRQLGVSSYNECISNNISYCMNMFKARNPGQYLEVDGEGRFWPKGTPITSSDYSGGSQPSHLKTSSQASSQSSSQTLSAEDYARVLSTLDEIDATIHTTPKTPAPPKKPRICGGCKGDGVCNACKGTGKERIIYSSAYTTCKACHGTGKCPHCSGTGHYSN